MFLVIVASTVLGGVLAWLAAESVTVLAYAGVFVFVIAGWVLSLSLHEFGHAYTAWRFGDHDVAVRSYDKGRFERQQGIDLGELQAKATA